MKKLLLAFILLLMACDSDPVRREKLGSGITIMRDMEGNYWAVSHNTGDTYFLQMLDEIPQINNMIPLKD